MRFSKLSILGSLLIMKGMVAATSVLAAVPDTKPLVECGDGALPGCGNQDLTPVRVITNIVPSLINILIFGVALISFAFLIKGGIDMITALGQEDKMKKAVKAMVTSAAGLILALLSYAIVAFITSLKLFT